MAKILLVEDDNNLREIYEARLQAEGYDIVAARDGEEALTVAMKERPDLIISDVMMPKISGFDMLDIIRSTEETKDVKVIMMTALSQAEDRERADKLGADRYLVKSQVTLEDVAKVAREVLNGASPARSQMTNPSETPVAAPIVSPIQTEPIAPVQGMPTQTTAPVVAAAPMPVALPVTPVVAPDQADSTTTSAASDQSLAQSSASQALAAVSPMTAPLADDVQDLSQPTDQEQADITAQIDSFVESSRPAPEKNQQTEPTPVQPVERPTVVNQQSPTDSNTNDSQSRTGKKVIQPLNNPTTSKGPDLDRLLEKEEERNQMATIAKDIAAKSTVGAENKEQTATVDNEFAAEEALLKAANHKTEAIPEAIPLQQQNNQETEGTVHAPEVAISEDGNLQFTSSSDAEPAAAPPTTNPSAISFEEAPAPVVQSTEAPVPSSDQLEQSPQQTDPQQQPTQPNIPHTNGTSIDGVSSPSSNYVVETPMEVHVQAAPESSNQAATNPTDNPDDIAL